MKRVELDDLAKNPVPYLEMAIANGELAIFAWKMPCARITRRKPSYLTVSFTHRVEKREYRRIARRLALACCFLGCAIEIVDGEETAAWLRPPRRTDQKMVRGILPNFSVLSMEAANELRSTAEQAAEAQMHKRKARDLRRRIKGLKDELSARSQADFDEVIDDLDRQLKEANERAQTNHNHFRNQMHRVEELEAKLLEYERRAREELLDGIAEN